MVRSVLSCIVSFVLQGGKLFVCPTESNYLRVADTGADPNAVAVDVLDAVARGKADFVVAATSSAKVAPWIRFFLPSVWNKILVNRYEKSMNEESLENDTNKAKDD